jgi:hypothetical protein
MKLTRRGDMEMTYLHERQEKDAFAERAAKHFTKHPEHWTFTDGEIEARAYFALKFGLGEDCVVVFRIDDEEPLNYQQIMERNR